MTLPERQCIRQASMEYVKSLCITMVNIVHGARPYFFPSSDRFQYAARGKEGLET